MGEPLAGRLREVWERQAAEGFLLAPADTRFETRRALHPPTGVEFRFRWLPHRELRGDAAELERRMILDPGRDRSRLFSDPRDPAGRHCFLCAANIRISHPREMLVPLEAGNRRWWAGANFAWLGRHHFTVMASDHVDQHYERSILDAMADLHGRTDGDFRIVFNAAAAGATIPWHLHLQIVSEQLPLEGLRPGTEGAYPAPLWTFPAIGDGLDDAHRRIMEWLDADPIHHRVNLLLAGNTPVLFATRRDVRRSHASNKGLMGGFEVAGDFAYSDPAMRGEFERADLQSAVRALREIRPPALDTSTG